MILLLWPDPLPDGSALQQVAFAVWLWVFLLVLILATFHWLNREESS